MKLQERQRSLPEPILIPVTEGEFVRRWDDDYERKPIKGPSLSDLNRLVAKAQAAVADAPGRSGERPGGLSGRRADASSPRLEQEGRKVTFIEREDFEKRFHRGVQCLCRSWQCPDCRKSKGMQVRKAILAKAGLFRIPRLYTITINPAWFESPEDAYDHVMGEKFIARLLTKEMGVDVWVWVLEVQKNAWPHWHILIDIGELPEKWYNRSLQISQDAEPSDKTGWHYHPHFFDLKKVHRLLRKWRIGEQCELSLKRGKFCDASHAINYITKYLVKMPPQERFPAWMSGKRRIRFYQPSRKVGSLLEEGKKVEKKEEGSQTERKERAPAARVAECGKKMAFIVFDEEECRYVFNKPSWGTKESLVTFPGVQGITGFNLRTGAAYRQWGFVDQKARAAFLEMWSSPDLVDIMKSQVDAKRISLLSPWDGECARDAAEGSAARLDDANAKGFSLPAPSSCRRTPRADGVESPTRFSASGGRGASVGGAGATPAVAAGEALRTGASKARFASPGAEGKSRQLEFPDSFFKIA